VYDIYSLPSRPNLDCTVQESSSSGGFDYTFEISGIFLLGGGGGIRVL